MNPIYKALAELDSQTEFNANPYYDSIEKLSRISQGMAHTPRLSEARAPNSQEWSDTLSFLKGGYTPQITGDMNGLARLMEYAKQDASQVADFFVGGLANYADQANFNQEHGYLDTGIAALEASPITAGLAKLSHLSSPMVKSLGNTLSDDALTTPMRNQIGAVGVKDLPMDEASRMARAREMGNDIPVYHASTHDISAFDLSRANPESDMGAAIYTTNSPADASFNYSSLDGQDLTARIQLRAEQLADEMGLDFDDPKVMEAAKDELYGGAENVMPLLGRMEKPLKIGGDDRTFLEYRMKELDPEDYLDDADGDMDLAQELAWDDAYNYEPEGELVDLINALQNNRFDVDASESIAKLSELGMDGGMYADDILDILKNDYNLMDAYDDSGALANNELIRQAFEDAGFDGIIDSGVNSKWGTGSGRTNYMRGMDEDTRHYLFFQPNRLRSRFAKFDPAKKDSADLLASKLLPIPAGLLGLTTLDPDN